MVKKFAVIFLILIIIIFAAAAAYFIMLPKEDPAPQLESILEVSEGLVAISAENVHPVIGQKFSESFELTLSSEFEEKFADAEADIKISYLDIKALTANLSSDMQLCLEKYVNEASRRQDVYNDNNQFLPELLERAYVESINARMEDGTKYMREATLRAVLKYSDKSWSMVNYKDLMNYNLLAFSDEMPGFEEAVSQLEYVDFHYSLSDWTSPGPVANPACYGETMDPAVISELLESPAAKKLINGQQLNWNPDIELIPDSPIRYYLDETLLTIVWQENEHGAIGTFAETFIADASQLRRKLADDTFGGQTFYYPTVLAKQSNAVLALSGDFYDLPSRVYGLYVYDGELLRYNLSAGQSCLFTDKGDMIFTYENQFATVEEAQQFIKDNNIMFSLSFGPVLIEKGVDKTPFDYPIGEIRDTYARCAVGQLGERHYLSMTINVRVPDYNVYVTLRQAADSMIGHGCYNAYTLDGGQTGSIILGGELINPVQFGYEREQSDIFYFATAIPN
ncbi:MAG: phosphodiester glycosidase family protein [Oscillospiraceae bacterium]|nr:phosphodiester glycosidase family protein [Oscillospiraceae bacterium]